MSCGAGIRTRPSRNPPCAPRTRDTSSSAARPPTGAGRDAVVGYAGGFVVDPAADQAHVFASCVGDMSRVGYTRNSSVSVSPVGEPFRMPKQRTRFPSGRARLCRRRSDRRRRRAGRRAHAFESMGCHPLSVVTAMTVQDTLGRRGRAARSTPSGSPDQARCVLEDMPVAAFKLGVMGSVENIAAIAEVVSDYPDVPLILDPVLALGPRRRVRERRDDRARCGELLLPQTTILDAQQRRGAAPRGRRRRRGADERDVRRTPDRGGLRVCAGHGHARARAGRQHALRQGGRRAHRHAGQRLPGAYPRRRLHAVRGDRRDARQRPRHAGSGERGAGIHLAHAEDGLRPGMGQFHPRPAFLGARGSEGRGDAPAPQRPDVRGSH